MFFYMNVKFTIWRSQFVVFLLITFQVITGQVPDSLDFNKIDSYAREAPAEVSQEIEVLAQYLAKPALNDFERARSFYVWLTTNISYDMKAFKNGRKRINQTNKDILTRRRAVCFGYSKFFKALCDEIGLASEVISGYSKGSLTSNSQLEEPDHAWNAVKLEGKWYLLDATWGAGVVYREDDFVHEFSEDYFLTPPEKLIVNHLPADPIWQLLPCAISAKDFRESPQHLLNLVSDKPDNCVNYADSLASYEKLASHEKLIATALHTYQFNSTEKNKMQLGHAYMDYEAYLDAKAIKLQETNDIDALLVIQQQIIANCERAENHIELYDRQKENLAYTYMNYAVTLSKKIPNLETSKDYFQIIDIYQKMLPYFEKALTMLHSLPSNVYIQDALKQCTGNIKAVKNNMGIYQQEMKNQ